MKKAAKQAYPKAVRVTAAHHYMLKRFAFKRKRDMADVLREAIDAFMFETRKGSK